MGHFIGMYYDIYPELIFNYLILEGPEPLYIFKGSLNLISYGAFAHYYKYTISCKDTIYFPNMKNIICGVAFYFFLYSIYYFKFIYDSSKQSAAFENLIYHIFCPPASM